MEHHDALAAKALDEIEAAEMLLRQSDRWREEFAVLTDYFNRVAAKDHPKVWVNENWREFRGELLQLQALKEHVSRGLDRRGEVYNYYFNMLDDLLDGNEEPFPERVEAMLAGMLDTAPPVLTKQDNPVAYAADQMQDSLKWVHGHGDENGFMLWLEGKLDQPTQMNCFDAVFYAAFMAGAVRLDDILEAYTDVFAGRGYASVESALGMGYGISMEQALSEGLDPGDVVVFNGDAAAHVALCLGGGDVMSLWGDNGGRFTRMRLLDLMGDSALSAMTVSRKGATIFR